MTKIFAITLLILTFVVANNAQAKCERYSPPGAGFSVCIPEGWTLQDDDKGAKFKNAVSPASSGSPANLIFLLDETPLKLKEYVDASNVETLKNPATLGFSSIKLASRSDFVTDTNEPGVKSVFLETYQGTQLYAVQYMYDAGKKKLIITFTTLESAKAVNEKIFDAAVKTLKADH